MGQDDHAAARSLTQGFISPAGDLCIAGVRTGGMETPTYCRGRAADMHRLAGQTTLPQVIDKYRATADAWLRMAAAQEALQSPGDSRDAWVAIRTDLFRA